MLRQYFRKLLPFPEKQIKYALLICFVNMMSIVGLSLVTSINLLNFIPPEMDEKTPAWINDFFIYNALATFAYFIFISFIIYLIMLVITSRFIGPLVRITRQIDAYHRGDFSYRLTLRKEDEINELSNQLNNLGEQLEKNKSEKNN